MSNELTILKLGGSVITDKDTPETIDDDALDRVVAAIADSNLSSLVVVHGGGSFGHVHAADHGVSTTDGSHDPTAVSAIHGAMKELNRAVIDRLQAAGVAAVPVHPLSAATRNESGELTVVADAVQSLEAEGFVPVLHGDLIAHAGLGVTVLSGDELVVALATELDATRVGICSTVPGVFDVDGDVLESITSFDAVAAAVGDSDTTDVSGGMAGKVRALLSLDGHARIFGPQAVGSFLAGETPGTLIDGSANAE